MTGLPDSRQQWDLVNRLTGFNLTVEDYDKLLRHQAGVCWGCNKEPTGLALSVDHHHGSGLVRGLLCFRCNRVLGAIERLDPWVVMRLIEYLHNPPAVDALGEERIGNQGRVGTKRWRAQTRRRKKEQNARSRES